VIINEQSRYCFNFASKEGSQRSLAFPAMPKPVQTPEISTEPVRQLAAVMFADMTGFTSMMQEDEQKARILRDRQRITLEKFIPGFAGKILQYFGDGTLSIFGSAGDAVRAAIGIQKELQQEPKVALRIGIHSGDIV